MTTKLKQSLKCDITTKKLILGASDAVTAFICSSKFGADYIWASSLIMSAMLGFKDDGMVNYDRFEYLLKAIIQGSAKPVILDFDIGGRDLREYDSNLVRLKELNLGGVCIEDEAWPKVNAILKDSNRSLVAPSLMAQKIKNAKQALGSRTLIIARTHSIIVKESLNDLQNRISEYEAAGADIVCVHYTGSSWQSFENTIHAVQIHKPLMLICSSIDYAPISIASFEYVLFPNQAYRMMIYPLLSSKQSITKEDIINNQFFRGGPLVTTGFVMDIVDCIYD